MTLAKAIAALGNLLVDDPHFEPERRRQAVRLGIEALSLICEMREANKYQAGLLLPGETKE